MTSLLVFLGIFALITWGLIANFREKRAQRRLADEISQNFLIFGKFSSIDEVASPIPELQDYFPTRGERVLEWASMPGGGGRLILTDKALVIEALQMNERIALTSVSRIEIFSDGLRAWKRNGKPKQWKIEPNARFLALAGSILNLQVSR